MWGNSNIPPKKENSKCGGLYNGFLTDFWCAGVASRGPPKHGAWCAPAACTTDPPANCGVTTGPTTHPPGSRRSPRSPLPPHQHQQPTPMPSREDSMSGVRRYVCAAAAGIAPQTRAVGLTRNTGRCVVSHAKWWGAGWRVYCAAVYVGCGSEAACNRTATEVFSGMRTEGQKARGRRDVERHHVDMNHARSECCWQSKLAATAGKVADPSQ